MLLLVLLAEGMLAAGETQSGSVPADLVVWNRTIVTFRVGVGLQASTSPSERALQAAARIAALPEAALTRPIEIGPATLPGIDGLVLTVDGHPLFAITTADLDLDSQQPIGVVASAAADQLRQAFAARIAQRQPRVIVTGIALGLGCTLALFVCLVIAFRLQRRVFAVIEHLRFPKVATIGGLDVMPLFRGLLRGGCSLATWVIAALMGFAWLTAVLGAFPYSKPWSLALGGFLGSMMADLGSALARSAPHLFMVAIIVLLTRGGIRLMSSFFLSVEQGTLSVSWLDRDTASATRRVATVIAWLLAITLAYPHIPGSNTAAFRGLSVIAGVMISLSSAGLINQVMSGMVIIYSRSMRLGDVVTAADTTGVVTAIGVLSTKLRTVKEDEVTIPNAALVADKVINYSRLVGPSGKLVSATVTIGYDAPWRQIHALLLLAAERCPNIRKDTTPVVLQRALSDFYVEYELRCRIDDPRSYQSVLVRQAKPDRSCRWKESTM